MIPKGTIILEEKPFAQVLMLDLQETHCDYCLKKKKDLKKCAKCGRVCYCNVECQTLGWKQCHKYECKDLSACPDDISEDARLLARIIWKLKKKSNREKFYNLDAGNKEFWEDVVRLRRFDVCFYNLCKFMRLSKAPHIRMVMEIYSRMIVNSFRICNHNFKIVAEGFHLLPKSLKHSCTPNVAYVYFEQTLIISTVEDLPEINWDKLTKRFADPVQSTTQRKMALTMYSRDCSCNRCIYPERDALCPNESCRAACSIEEDTCPVCKEVLTREFKRNYLDAILFTNKNTNFDSLTPDKLKTMYLCMRKLQKVVLPVHYKYIHMIEKMHVMEGASGHWMMSLKYLEEMLVGFLHFYGPLSVQSTQIYIQLSKFHLRLDNKKEYVKAVNNAGKILQSLFGADRAKEVMQRISSDLKEKVYKNDKKALHQKMQQHAERSHLFRMKF